MGKGKLAGIQACADSKGVIAAAAADQRGSLKKAIAKARGSDISNADLTEFKKAVTAVLTKHASAILMDPEYGLPALQAKDPDAGVLLAYEKTGYDADKPGRLPDLLSVWSVKRLVEAGANGIKILLYYNAFDKPEINEIKHAFIERIGAECQANDVPFFLEPIAYDDALDEKGPEFAKVKPRHVTRYMEEFSKARYGVDVLKVEVPVNMKFTEGTSAYAGSGAAYSRSEAIRLFQESAAVATKPFIYLSAGVTDEVFRETLELAAEANTPFAGVLCGRATWQDGIPVYAKGGYEELMDWLEDRGVQNITALNTVLAKGAKPWWTIYGGLENIEAV
jgi:tagatose 1,6-diphosphate aldolase